jgi:hypothetical protein
MESDLATQELLEFRAELRDADPALLSHFRGLILCFTDRTIADELVQRTVDEIDAALTQSGKEFH